MSYATVDRRTIAEVVDAVDKICPAMNRKGAGHRRLLEYCMFSAWRDEERPERLVIDQQIIYQLYPEFLGHKGLREILTDFEAYTGIPLHYEQTDIERPGTIRPELPPELVSIRDKHLTTPVESRCFYFQTGTTATQRRERRILEKRKAELRDRREKTLEKLPQDDPRRRRIHLLASNSGRSRELLMAAAGRLRDTLGTIADEGAERVRELKRYTRIVADLAALPLEYGPTDNSPRLYPVSESLMCHTRLFRKLHYALTREDGGVFELDLTRCHWSVAASILGLQESKLLLARAKPWDELTDYLGVSSQYKPIVKRVLLSTLYGMARDGRGDQARRKGNCNLRTLFLEGQPRGFFPVKGLNDPRLWTKFTRHPAISELLEKRRDCLELIDYVGGAEDVYDNWVSIEDASGRVNSPAVLSYVLQSYEQAIIDAALEEVGRQRQLYVLAYTYDGLVLYCSDSGKAVGRVNAVKAAADECAAALGINTHLEIEVLDSDKILGDIERALAEIRQEDSDANDAREPCRKAA